MYVRFGNSNEWKLHPLYNFNKSMSLIIFKALPDSLTTENFWAKFKNVFWVVRLFHLFISHQSIEYCIIQLLIKVQFKNLRLYHNSWKVLLESNNKYPTTKVVIQLEKIVEIDTTNTNDFILKLLSLFSWGILLIL